MAGTLTRIWDGITASGLEGRSPEASVFARQLNGFVAAGGLVVVLAALPIAFGGVPETMPVAVGFALFALAFVFLLRFVPDQRLRLCGHVAAGGAICAVGVAMWIEDPTQLLNGFWWLALVILPVVHLLGRVAGVGWTAVAVAILGVVTVKDVRATGIESGEAIADFLAQASFLIGVLAVGSFVRTLSVRQIAELERQRRTIGRQRAELDSVRVRAETAGSAARASAAQLETALEDRRDADGAKAMLLDAVSHEIRDPLNTVLGSCALLLGGSLTPEQTELAGAIRDAATALLESVDGLVDLGRLESAGIELEASPFRIDDLLVDVTQSLAQDPPLVPAGVTSMCGKDLDFEVVGDSAKLARVLKALAEFGVGLNPDSGVRVTAEAVADGTVQFEVTSSPLGVEHARALRAALTRAEDHGPLVGPAEIRLGLAGGLVRLMRGRLTTQVDSGAFRAHLRIPLPRSETSPQARDDDPGDESPLGILRILLVDASREDRLAVEDQLATWRVACESVDSLADATERDYDVVVISPEQPQEGDIPAVVAAARGFTHPGGDVLLVLPRHVMPGDVDGALFVRKPVPMPDLRELLESATGRRRGRTGPPGSVETGSGGGCVLVVEDNAVNAKISCRLLEKMGIPAVSLNNGLEALRYIEENDVDAVLMDCHMPVMDGFEATRLLRRWEDRTGGHVPVIALTGRSGDEERRRCLAAGMDDYLSKPVSLEALAAVFARIRGDVTGRA